MRLHETDPALPINDLLLTDITRGIARAPTSEILDFFAALLPELLDFKKKIIDDNSGYSKLKHMLKTSHYVDWLHDHKEQYSVTS